MATKQTKLAEALLELAILFKRFAYSNKSKVTTKLDKPVKFPDILDIRGLIEDDDDDEYRYQSVAVVKHIGSSPLTGHYTTITRTNDGTFYEFDDAIVSPVDIQDVLQIKAYMLFYERIY